MKTVGIIAEYNPYHRGHKYHLERTLEKTNADCVVTVMSGNFTQRGEISPWDKWQRSESAIIAGANLVLELPFIYAVNRGEMFAKGAVDILAKLGVDCISFGSESGDIDELINLSEDIEKRAGEIKEIHDRIMKEGNSYASSYSHAVEQVLGEKTANLLKTPNNILALEYIRRINYWKTQGVDIEPVTIKRFGSGYFEVNDESGYAGASEIRDLIAGGDKDAVAYFVPEEVRHMMDSAVFLGPAEAKVLDIIHEDAIRQAPKELAEIYCMGEGLENRIVKEVKGAYSIHDLIDKLTSKRYTASSMRRLILYMVMNLRFKEPPQGIYGRVLAADEIGRELIRSVKKNENGLPIITNVNKDIPDDLEIQQTIELDIKAADIYNFLVGRDEYKCSDRVIKPFIL